MDCSWIAVQRAGRKDGEDRLVAEGMLIAWIEQGGDGQTVAAFVGETLANSRRPARQAFDTPAEARGWVEREAGQLSLPVTWLTPVV